MNQVRVQILLEPRQHVALKKVAKRQEKSVSELVRQIADEYLARNAPDQDEVLQALDNLKSILDNEQKELKQAEEEESKKMEKAIKKVKINFNSFEYKERKRLRLIAEKEHEEQEAKHEEDLLRELENV